MSLEFLLKSFFVAAWLVQYADSFTVRQPLKDCAIQSIRHHHGVSSVTTRLYSTQVEDPVILVGDSTIEDDDEADELVDSVTEKLEEMEGLWYSDDFYGPHGREWVQISAKLSLTDNTASTNLVAIKITGDPNVPAGCVTFQTNRWPGMGEKVAAQIQVRADPTDPNGFEWIPGELTLVAKDEIQLMCQYNFLMKSQGTFYKQNDDESDDDN